MRQVFQVFDKICGASQDFRQTSRRLISVYTGEMTLLRFNLSLQKLARRGRQEAQLEEAQVKMFSLDERDRKREADGAC